MPISALPGIKRIATEEAWAPTTMLDAWRQLLQKKSCEDPGFQSMWGFFLNQNAGYTNDIIDRLQNLGEGRIADMDSAGIDMQLLLLTAPGVQVFDRDDALAVARASNDEVSAACREYPSRFAALAAIPPQDPGAAALEMERAINQLGLKGVVINSHTKGEYLDDHKFWPIFEAAEALDAAIYIHPQTPPKNMSMEFIKRNLEGAIMGFAVEVALHVVAIVLSGAFERFPKLKIVIGHAGEGLPYWLYRLDHQQQVIPGSMGANKLKRRISEYIRENVYVTTSGMGWEPAILFCQQTMVVDHVLYAMDYLYQFVHEEVTTHDKLPISTEDLRKLYQTNAERIFHLLSRWCQFHRRYEYRFLAKRHFLQRPFTICAGCLCLFSELQVQIPTAPVAPPGIAPRPVADRKKTHPLLDPMSSSLSVFSPGLVPLQHVFDNRTSRYSRETTYSGSPHFRPADAGHLYRQ